MESANVMIHVRFAPNGTVIEISERPPALSPQDWFNTLAIRLAWSIRRFLAGAACFALHGPRSML